MIWRGRVDEGTIDGVRLERNWAEDESRQWLLTSRNLLDDTCCDVGKWYRTCDRVILRGMKPVIAPSLDEIREAAHRLRGIVVRSPLVPLHSHEAAPDLLLKLETLQCVNSFKIRGVFNAVAKMNDARRRAGISTVSAGNTAQALAWAGRHFGVPARSVMPETAPTSKVDAVRAYGATPVLVPMEEVFRYMREHLWDQEPYAFVHPWTDRDVMIGHATMALEILEDCPDLESIFVPVGGGGLIGGVATAIKLLKPAARVVAVEPSGCASLHDSIQAGKPVSVDCQTICDGVAVPYMTEELFPLLRDVVDQCVLVSDERVKEVMRRLALGNKLIVEPSAALATAAALDMSPRQRGRSVCLVTGGSINADKFAAILTAQDLEQG